jgi:hypothetical protein
VSDLPSGYYRATVATDWWLETGADLMRACVRDRLCELKQATGYDGNERQWLLIRVPVNLGGSVADRVCAAAHDSVFDFGCQWEPTTADATAQSTIPEELAAAAEPGLLDTLDEWTKRAEAAQAAIVRGAWVVGGAALLLVILARRSK